MTQTDPSFWPAMAEAARHKAEREEAERLSLPPWPTSRSGRPARRAVCGLDGNVIEHRQGRCPRPAHQNADLYEWRNAHTVGLHLLTQAYERGEELERWVEEAVESDLKGTDRLTVSWLLSMGLTHWGLFRGPAQVRAETTLNSLYE